MILPALLVVFMIVGAVIALGTDNLLSAIVSVGATGFLLAIVFLFLGAPDLAVTQLVVEILALVILIRATIRRDLVTVSGDRAFLGLAVTATLLAVFAAVAIRAFAAFPEAGLPVMDRIAASPGVPGPPSVHYLSAGLRDTGAPNAVTAILLDYRAYDTLGEATVLFCSVMGALAVLRRRAKKRDDEPDAEHDEP